MPHPFQIVAAATAHWGSRVMDHATSLSSLGQAFRYDKPDGTFRRAYIMAAAFECREIQCRTVHPPQAIVATLPQQEADMIVAAQEDAHSNIIVPALSQAHDACQSQDGRVEWSIDTIRPGRGPHQLLPEIQPVIITSINIREQSSRIPRLQAVLAVKHVLKSCEGEGGYPGTLV